MAGDLWSVRTSGERMHASGARTGRSLIVPTAVCGGKVRFNAVRFKSQGRQRRFPR